MLVICASSREGRYYQQEGITVSVSFCDNTITIVACFVTKCHMVVNYFQYITITNMLFSHSDITSVFTKLLEIPVKIWKVRVIWFESHRYRHVALRLVNVYISLGMFMILYWWADWSAAQFAGICHVQTVMTIYFVLIQQNYKQDEKI